MWYVIPYFQTSNLFTQLNPIQSYITYNIGVIFLFSAVFGIPIGYFIHGKVNINDIIRGGFSSFIGFSWFIDMWSTPLAWDKYGTLLIQPTASNMEASAVDYMFGWIFLQLGVHGSIVYDLVYIGIPIISIIIMALILKPKELLKIIS